MSSSISVLADSRNGGSAYIIPSTSAAGGKATEWESDVGKPDGAQSEGRLSSGSCVFAADRLMGMMCPAYRAFL